MKKIIFLFLFLIHGICSSQQPACEYILTSGNTDINLEAILSSIDNNNCVGAKIVVKGEVTLSNAHTIDKDIDLVFDIGGFFNVDGELTINCSIQAGLYKIFGDIGIVDNLNVNGTPSTYKILPQWFGAKINDQVSDSNGINLAINFAHQGGGGTVFFPSGEYIIDNKITMMSNVFLEGEGDSSVLYNISANDNTIEAIGNVPDGRIHSIGFKNLLLKGNLNIQSGKTGIYIQNSFSNFWPRVNPTNPSPDYYSKRRGDPIVISDVAILHHQDNGIYLEEGSLYLISGCTIEGNQKYGIHARLLTNSVIIESSAISRNGKSGVYMDWVASTISITNSQMVNNKDYGALIYGVDNPTVVNSYFGGNRLGGVKISGDPNHNRKTYGALISGCQFTDSGYLNNGSASEIRIDNAYATTITSYTFYDLNNVPDAQSYSMIDIYDNVEGCVIQNNGFARIENNQIYWGELFSTTEKVRFNPNSSYSSQKVTFDDNSRQDNKAQIYSRNKYIEYLNDGVNNVVFQTKQHATDEYAPPNFILKNSGEMNWGGGGAPVDIILERLSADILRLTSHFQAKTIGIKKVSSSNITNSNIYGTIFLDPSDSKLKIKLPGGIVKILKYE